MLLRCRRLIELLGRSGLISEQEGFPLVGGDSRLRRLRPVIRAGEAQSHYIVAPQDRMEARPTGLRALLVERVMKKLFEN